MQTFLTVLLVLFLLFVFGVTAAFFVLRSKARRFLAGGRLALLKAALDDINERLTTPENAENAELKALHQRVETAHTQAKAAYDRGDFAKVGPICDPVLAELVGILQKLAEEAQAKAEADRARQEAEAGGLVIEGTFVEVKDPVALLPAPDATTDGANAPADGATPAAAADKTGTEGDVTPKQ